MVNVFSHEFWFCSYSKSGFLIWGSGITFWLLQDASNAGSQYIMCLWLTWKWSWSQCHCLSYGMWLGSAGTWLEVCQVPCIVTITAWSEECDCGLSTTAVRGDAWNPQTCREGHISIWLGVPVFLLYFLRNIEQNKFKFDAFVRMLWLGAMVLSVQVRFLRHILKSIEPCYQTFTTSL